MFEDLKKTVLEANQLLVKSNLVILNWETLHRSMRAESILRSSQVELTMKN